MREMNILITGVGGQGTLLTSRILGALACRLGRDVKVSEVHGMAQRGGSVITYVRIGDEVASPLIEEGGADYMISFELIEALRNVHLVKKGGRVIVSTQRIAPMTVVAGTARYPDDALPRLRASDVAVDAVDALELARQAGSIRAVNTVMLGRMARLTGISRQTWLDAVGECLPPGTYDVNRAAFDAGYHLIIEGDS